VVYDVIIDMISYSRLYCCSIGVLLAPGIDSRPMLIFPLSLGSRLFLIVLICLIFCYTVLIRVDVSVPSGAFLSLAGILLFLFVLLVLSMSVLK